MLEKNPYTIFGTFTKPKDIYMRTVFSTQDATHLFSPIFSFENWHWTAKAKMKVNVPFFPPHLDYLLYARLRNQRAHRQILVTSR